MLEPLNTLYTGKYSIYNIMIQLKLFYYVISKLLHLYTFIQ